MSHNGLICMGLLVVGLIREALRSGKPKETVTDTIKEIDFFTLLLLAGLFVVIAGITEAGVITR